MPPTQQPGPGTHAQYQRDDRVPAILLLREAYPIQSPALRAQNSTKLLSAIADLYGGRLLEPAYLGTKALHRFCCAAGHRFSSVPYRLFAGGWCKDCHVASRKLGIAPARELARAKKGECLSTQYIDIKQKLHWQCERGHRWQASFDMVKKGRWCPTCAHKYTPEQMMARLKAAARNHGGQLLSGHYVDNATKMIFRCRAGHEWHATPAHVLNGGTWCPTCAGQRTPAEQLQRLRQYAAQQGGELVSDQYANNRTKVRMRCQLGHEWSAEPSSLLQGHWCKRCSHLSRRTYEHRKSLAQRMHNL